jgi:MFS family permease
MPRRSLAPMWLAFALVNGVSQSTGALWPAYLARLGGGPAFAGYFNGAALLAVAAGALMAGWLADRFQHRKQFFSVACAVYAACWLLESFVTNLLLLTALSTLAGFAFGIAFNMIGILTGLLAAETQRGRAFGLLAVAMSVGVICAALAFGPVVDGWGFPALLTLNALISMVCAVLGFFFHDVDVRPPFPVTTQSMPRSDTEMRSVPGRRAPLGRDFTLLMVSALFASVAMYGAGLGRAVVMNLLGFSATSISITTAIGAAVALPAPFLIGWLSDRTGRKGLILLCSAAGLAGLLVLAWAVSPVAFWAGAAMMALMNAAPPVAQAWIADLVPARSLGIALALLSATGSLAGFIGSALTGATLQSQGQQAAFILIMLWMVVGMLLLLPIHDRHAAGRRAVASSGS